MQDAIRLELLRLERGLLDPETRHSSEWLDRVLADGMVEFGKSGRVFDKDAIIAALTAEAPSASGRFELTAPSFVGLGPDAMLLTYRLEPLVEGEVSSLRSSVWKRTDGRWQLIFHQGTAAG